MSSPSTVSDSHSGQDSPQFSRLPVIIGLVLAVVLGVGVLIGARIVSDRAGNVPVAMTPLPAPEADSPECSQLIESLPDELVGHDRADISSEHFTTTHKAEDGTEYYTINIYNTSRTGLVLKWEE